MNPGLQAALQLRDIHVPAAPPFWPPAPGWWVAVALLLGMLSWMTLLGLRRYRIRRERRRLLSALGRLERRLESERTPEALAHISVLLRRLALLRFPRRQVAALTGEAWLRFLDESGGRGRFAEGPGRVLADAPYRRKLPAEFDVATLVVLLREWVVINAQERR